MKHGLCISGYMSLLLWIFYLLIIETSSSPAILSEDVAILNATNFDSAAPSYTGFSKRDDEKPELWVFTVRPESMNRYYIVPAVRSGIEFLRIQDKPITGEKFIEGLNGGCIWFYINASESTAKELFDLLKIGSWVMGYERPDAATSSNPYTYEDVELSGSHADDPPDGPADDVEDIWDRKGRRLLKRGGNPEDVLGGVIAAPHDLCVLSQPPEYPTGTVRKPVQDGKCTYLFDKDGGLGTLVYIFSTGIFKKHETFKNVDWSEVKWLSSDVDTTPFTDDEDNPMGTMAASKIVGLNLGVAPKTTLAIAKGTNKHGKLTWYSVIETMILLGKHIREMRASGRHLSRSPIFIAFTWELAAHQWRHKDDISFVHQELFKQVVAEITHRSRNTLLLAPGDWPRYNNKGQIHADPILSGFTIGSNTKAISVRTIGASDKTNGIVQKDDWHSYRSPVYAPANQVTVATKPPVLFEKEDGTHIAVATVAGVLAARASRKPGWPAWTIWNSVVRTAHGRMPLELYEDNPNLVYWYPPIVWNGLGHNSDDCGELLEQDFQEPIWRRSPADTCARDTTDSLIVNQIDPDERRGKPDEIMNWVFFISPGQERAASILEIRRHIKTEIGQKDAQEGWIFDFKNDPIWFHLKISRAKAIQILDQWNDTISQLQTLDELGKPTTRIKDQDVSPIRPTNQVKPLSPSYTGPAGTESADTPKKHQSGFPREEIYFPKSRETKDWALGMISRDPNYPDDDGIYRYDGGEGKSDHVYIYVVDSGAHLDHPVFSHNQPKEYIMGSLGEWLTRWLTREKSIMTDDDEGHGTAVLSRIIGKDMGTAPQANIIPVKVSDSHGWMSYSDVLLGLTSVIRNMNNKRDDAIERDVTRPCFIINLSCSWENQDNPEMLKNRASLAFRWHNLFDHIGERSETLLVMSAPNDERVSGDMVPNGSWSSGWYMD
ncbi:hypothetical protein TWF696_001586 [Orbilia brochopaga]|uniref:Peptidase S8/S53 domain-containing protein n=1 Tax=Orbilia brochopaga TaxID=3140254 RepID=A0AAV9U9A6_9PEZI